MGTQQKVLIIDDDNRNIFALAAYLKSKKIASVSAGNATEGISMLEKDENIGAVLMDVMMPGMDGYEAMRLIRSKEKFRHLPLIAVTAQAMMGDKEKSLDAGASAYISKPINTERLIQLLNDYLK